MGIGAEHTRNGKAYLAIVCPYQCHFAFSAIAFKLYHIRRQAECVHNAHDSASAGGATVSNCGAFIFKYHLSFPRFRGIPHKRSYKWFKKCHGITMAFLFLFLCVYLVKDLILNSNCVGVCKLSCKCCKVVRENCRLNCYVPYCITVSGVESNCV